MAPSAQFADSLDAIHHDMGVVLRSGQFILGENVRAFEAEAAASIGVKHAIGVANGTDALIISLRILGVKPGDEVICPSYTFYATAESIAAVGATPVFADVDPATWNLDPESVRAKISGRTKAIIPVHLFGQVANMEALRAIADEHDLKLLEDAAQAWGAERNGQRAGSMGDAATFSFFPTKNLPCFGDGGLIATNSDELAEQARILRFHGSKDKQTFTQIGYNSRLDELQAVVLRHLIKEVDGWNAHRRTVAGWYEEAGLGELVTLPQTDTGCSPIYHLYVVATPHRDALQKACADAGVGAVIYYGNSLHLQPVFQHLGGSLGDLPVTERMSREGIALPMFATMTRDQVNEVVAAVRAGVPARAGAPA
jgi:dTDP-4-amino-4,6-dideoxygalactose transaminase